MDGPRRAYDILRGYVNREWDRLQGDAAEAELDAPIVASPTETAGPLPAVLDVFQARGILGVTPTATFIEIKQAYLRLEERSDPAKFPSGSIEARKAGEIRQRVREAFALLSEHCDPTERRFGNLEIE